MGEAAKIMEKILNGTFGADKTELKDDFLVCPECGAQIIPSEGCAFCPSCGWSPCK